MLRRLFVAGTLYTITLAIIMLVARLILQNNFNRITDETTLATAENHKTERLINELNAKIVAARAIQQGGFKWTDFLVAFPKLVPNGVVLASLQLQAAGTPSTIAGHATTRDDLLKFRERLTAAPYISNVNLPIGDLLARDNLNFTISLTVDLRQVPPYASP